MPVFNVGDYVTYKNSDGPDYKYLGYITSERYQGTYKILWIWFDEYDGFQSSLSEFYPEEYLMGGEPPIQNIGEWKEFMHEELVRHGIITLTQEERICKKIKELDDKWKKRMAQKKADASVTNHAPSVEAETISGYTTMGINTVSGAGTAVLGASRYVLSRISGRPWVSTYHWTPL